MRYTLLILLIFSCHFVSTAQNSTKKAKVEELIALSDSIFPLDEVRALRLLEKADSLARSIHYKHGIFSANLSLASTKKYNPLESKKHLQDVAHLLYTATITQKTDYFLFLGFSFGQLGDKSKALENYFKADSLAEISQVPQHKGRVADYIASFYFNEEAYEKALQYIHKSHRIYVKLKNDYSTLNALLNIGVIYEKLNKKDSALFYLHQSITKSNNIYGVDNVFSCYTYYEIAKVYFKNDDFERCRINLEKARQLLNAQNEQSIDGVLIYELFGDYYMKNVDEEKGLEFYKKAYSIAANAQLYDSQLNLSKKISDHFLKKNPEALVYFTNYIRLKDSLETTEKDMLKEQLIVQYEVREKDKQTDLLRRDLLLKEQELTQQNIILFSAILLSILTILVVFLLYKRKQQKAKFKYLEVEQKLLRTQMNPHFVFNSLNSIQNYLLNNETEKSVAYLSKFAKLIRGILESSREEFILLDDEVELMTIYLEYQKIQTDQLFDFSVVCDDELLEEGIKLPPLLIQPFIENAIKHAFKEKNEDNKITVSYRLEKNDLVVTIEDNGTGIKRNNSNTSSHHSYSIQITEERIQNINAIFKRKIMFSVHSDQGTKVKFTIPQM